MQIYVGRRYLRRNGTRTEQMCANIRSTVYPFQDGEYTYTTEGTYSHSGEESPYDLVSCCDAVKMVVGRRYVRRDGSITSPIQHNPNSEDFPFVDDQNLTYTADGWIALQVEHRWDLMEEVIGKDVVEISSSKKEIQKDIIFMMGDFHYVQTGVYPVGPVFAIVKQNASEADFELVNAAQRYLAGV